MRRAYLIRLVAVFLSIWLSTPLVFSQTMRAHFIDVGQGAATLIEFPCAAILIDTGGELNGEFNSTDHLIDYLDAFFASRTDLNKTLHLLVLTHPHIDHTRGVSAILGKYRVLNAATNGHETGSGKLGQKALHQKVANTESTPDPNDDIGFVAVWLRDIPQGAGLTNTVIDPVSCPTVDPKITALWGRVSNDIGWSKSEFENLNNHSVAIRIDFGNASMLVSGDLEESAIPDFVAHYHGTNLLDIDVYQVQHHGSHNGTTDELLLAMTPKIAVIGMGPADREVDWSAWAYGHPRKSIIDLLQTHVSQSRTPKSVPVATAAKKFTNTTVSRAIYGTAWDGNVILEADINGNWRLVTSAPATTLVNLNTANAEELQTLPMIGQGRAEAIIEYRKQNGPFTSVEDLLWISGIGAGTISAIRNLVTTGN